MKRSGISSLLGTLAVTLALGCGAPGEEGEVGEAGKSAEPQPAVQGSARPLELTSSGSSGALYLCCDANLNCYPAPNNHPWNCGPAPVILACTTKGCSRH